jgi:hypothetical protein
VTGDLRTYRDAARFLALAESREKHQAMLNEGFGLLCPYKRFIRNISFAGEGLFMLNQKISRPLTHKFC